MARPGRLLLDTHALLWWLFDDPALPARVRGTIADAEVDILVSAATGWEIATKSRIGKLPEAGDAAIRLPALLRQAHIGVLPIDLDHALAAGALPGPHKDPFDRMIIAQALALSLPVATNDKVFGAYGAEVFW